ncbi:unnamed protein product [Linum trigynum]
MMPQQLRVLESESMTLKEKKKATVAVEAITADSENDCVVSTYGVVLVLIEACRSGDFAMQPLPPFLFP